MTLDRSPIRYYPKVSIERRIYAFAIDFISIWFPTSFFDNNVFLFTIIFLFLWWIARVVIPERNHGQSLGHWLLDIRVIDPRFDRTPGMLELNKREGIAGLTAVLAMWGLTIGLNNGLSMILLLSPLLADGGIALSDPELYRSFHDRIAKTITITSKRGFSLDIRLKQLFLLAKNALNNRSR
jgi:uncharacterized RDD family membrane protein YckC